MTRERKRVRRKRDYYREKGGMIRERKMIRERERGKRMNRKRKRKKALTGKRGKSDC